MKITGAEFIEWYDNHWPFDSDDWYFEEGEIPLHNPDGTWALDPAKTYDAEELGAVFHKGLGEDPTHGDGYATSTLIKAWRRTRDVNIVTIEIPKSRDAEIRAELKALGIKIVAG